MDTIVLKKELYDKITPALDARVAMLRREGENLVKKEDIWNYLSLKVWPNKENLTLDEVVNDIFSVDKDKLREYVNDLIDKQNRTIIWESENNDR